MLVSIASMLLGSLAAIGQRNIKRLMAYSSIGHIGYALIGLAAGTAGRHPRRADLPADLRVHERRHLRLHHRDAPARPHAGADLRPFRPRADRSWRWRWPSRSSCSAWPASRRSPASGASISSSPPPCSPACGRWRCIGVLTSVIGAYYYIRIIKVMYFDAAAGGVRPARRPRCPWSPRCRRLFTTFFFVLPGPLRRRGGGGGEGAVRVTGRRDGTAGLGAWRLEVFAQLPSTSDLCRARAEAGEPEGLAILALRQSAGRGTPRPATGRVRRATSSSPSCCARRRPRARPRSGRCSPASPSPRRWRRRVPDPHFGTAEMAERRAAARPQARRHPGRERRRRRGAHGLAGDRHRRQPGRRRRTLPGRATACLADLVAPAARRERRGGPAGRHRGLARRAPPQGFAPVRAAFLDGRRHPGTPLSCAWATGGLAACSPASARTAPCWCGPAAQVQAFAAGEVTIENGA